MMTNAIFRDDSTSADKRQTALNRLMQMCPREYRMIVKPYVEIALSRTSDAEVDALLFDVTRVQSAAETGDWGQVMGIAQKYGATDDQLKAFLPALTNGSNAA